MWRFGRVAIAEWVAAGGVGGDEPLVALRIGGRCTPALFHVAAADPARAGGHAQVACGRRADHGAHRVRAVAVVVARRGRVEAARVAGRGVGIVSVDGVVPAIVVVGGAAAPAAILRLEGFVLPVVAGVLAADDRALTGDALGPYRRRADEGDIPLDTLCRCPLDGTGGCGQGDALGSIRIDVRHLRPRRQRLHQGAVATHPEHVGHPVGTVGRAAGVEQGAQRGLGACGDGGQRLVDGTAALRFVTQPRRATQVGHRVEDDQKLGRRAVGCGCQQCWVGLGRPGGGGVGSRRADRQERSQDKRKKEELRFHGIQRSEVIGGWSLVGDQRPATNDPFYFCRSN